MIVARLETKTDPDGRKYLGGSVVIDWPLKRGCPVVLKRDTDGSYFLAEVGERLTQFSEQGTLSFVEPFEGEWQPPESTASRLKGRKGKR